MPLPNESCPLKSHVCKYVSGWPGACLHAWSSKKTSKTSIANAAGRPWCPSGIMFDSGSKRCKGTRKDVNTKEYHHKDLASQRWGTRDRSWRTRSTVNLTNAHFWKQFASKICICWIGSTPLMSRRICWGSLLFEIGENAAFEALLTTKRIEFELHFYKIKLSNTEK